MTRRHLIVLEDLAGVPLPDDAHAPRDEEHADAAKAERGGPAPQTADAPTPKKVEPWPDLDALEQREVPPRFPTDALPIVLRDYVEAVAAATETPRDWGAMLSLAAVASVAQEHYCVDIPGKLHPDPLGIAIGIVSPPATRKSEIFRAYSTPLVAIEVERQRRWEAERTAAGDAPFTKPRPRILFDDAGPEYLGQALEEQGGQVSVWSAEGSALANACGRYAKGRGAMAIELFLQALAGDRISGDRCGKDGRHVSVDNPSMVFAATMQPHVLDAIAGDEQLRGRGLVARILWIVAPHGLGHRSHRARPLVPHATQVAYARAIELLSRRPINGTGRVAIKLDDDAREVFVRMLEEREPKLADGGELESVRDWAGKLESLFCRVAALLALVEGTREVDERNARRARAICKWALAHAKRALAPPIDPAVRRVRELHRWTSMRERFTKREASEALKGRTLFEKAEDLDAPLRELVERGYIRRAQAERKVGRPREAYEVRPRDVDRGSSADLTNAIEPSDRDGEVRR